MGDKVSTFREKLVEAAAEADDALIEKYLEGEELSDEELRRGLRVGTIEGKVVPVMVGSALQNKNITELMDAICNYLPSPGDAKEVEAQNTETKKEELIEPDEKGPLAALVFKTTADPYVGKLTFLRVYSGTMNSDSGVWNATKGHVERIGQLYRIRGKSQESVAQIPAGDIGAVAKLSDTATSDTLCTKEHPLVFNPIEFPSPTLSVAVYPKTKADLDKMGGAITKLSEEDSTLTVHKDLITS
jgi:elongation factor G